MNDLMTIAEVADLLKCSTMTVRRMIKANEFGPVLRRGTQFVRIYKSAVEKRLTEMADGTRD